MKNFYGYIRVSTARQGVQGVSLVEQKDAISRHAIRHGITIIEWFEERESAATVGRPIFDRMVKLLKASKANGVIIHKIDRSARNMLEWGYLTHLLDLAELGIDVQSATDNIDLKTRAGRLTADMLAVVAADYSRNLRDEVRKGFYGRLKQGFYPLPAPLGYLNCGGGKIKEVDPICAPLVQKTFDLYRTGRYSERNLLKLMTELGLRNRSGKPLVLNGISVMLNNPFYIGLCRVRKTGELFEGNHQPLISKAVFDRVQSILRDRTKGKVVTHEFLFRRMFKCTGCGYSLIGELQKGHVYYRCQTGTCPMKCVREDILEIAVTKYLAGLEFNAAEQQYLRSRVTILTTHWSKSADTERTSIQLRLAQNDDRLTRLTDAFIDQAIDRDTFVARKETLLMERKGLEERFGSAEERSRSLPTRLTEFLELAETASILYEMQLPEETRDLLQIVTSNRRASPNEIVIEPSKGFSDIANRYTVLDCAPHRDVPRTLDTLLSKIITWLETSPDEVHERIHRLVEAQRARQLMVKKRAA